MKSITEIIDPLIESLEKPTRIEFEESPLTDRASYLDTLMEEAAYEVIRREGVFSNLSGEEWGTEAKALGKEFAAILRPVIDEYVANRSGEQNDV